MFLGGQFYGLGAIMLFKVPGEMGGNLSWLKSPTAMPILKHWLIFESCPCLWFGVIATAMMLKRLSS